MNKDRFGAQRNASHRIAGHEHVQDKTALKDFFDRRYAACVAKSDVNDHQIRAPMRRGGHRIGDIALYGADSVAETLERFREGDPHLRSFVSVNGYHVHATDGDLGHVENFLADDVNWDIRYLVIATRDWWPGKHVQLAPFAVKDIDWSEHRINLEVTRDQVKSSPAWDPLALEGQVGEQQLHRHFGWPGYGW